MPIFGIDDFKAQLKGGGARPNLFKVTVAFPTGLVTGNETKASFMIKAASLPASTIGVVEIPYQGKKLIVAGDRTFEPWTITVINDTDFEPYDNFTDWMAQITAHRSSGGSTKPSDYSADLQVDQLDKDGTTILKTFSIVGAWPSSVSSIEVSNDSSDTIEEFTVEFQMLYFLKSGGTTSRLKSAVQGAVQGAIKGAAGN